jgi:hypothetical protein
MDFANGSAELFTGIFGTPVNTEHFDLDLFFEVSGGGDGFQEFQIKPALEMNFDIDPDLQIFGLFLRAGVPVYTREILPPSDEGKSAHKTVAHINTTLGMYLAVAHGHQILARYNTAFHPGDSGELNHTVDAGAVSVGYNILLHPSIELITELFFNLPQDDESFSSGVMIGFVGTILPAAASLKNE